MDPKPRHEEHSLATNETVAAQHPVALAIGDDAVSAIVGLLIKLTPRQRSFLRLRSYYDSDDACAAHVGVVPATIRQWKSRNADFLDAYEQLPAQPLLHARADMLLLLLKAINTVEKLLDNPNPRICLRAAAMVLKGRDAQLLTNGMQVEPDRGISTWRSYGTRGRLRAL